MYGMARMRQFQEGARAKLRGRYPHMSKNRETDRGRQAAQFAAMRETVHEVRAQAVMVGMTEPEVLEDFIIGALQLEWPWLSDTAARAIIHHLKPDED